NSHIDFSRSGANQYLVQKSLKELYKNEFGQAQADYNDKQKRSDRKIKNYYDQVKAGKKTSLQQEMILQVGGREHFEENPENQKLANEVLKEWFDKFEERNPNLKVYNAVIHNDEASPHMHLNFVPVATGYQRGMDKQVSFDKAILQQEKTLDKERPFDDWRNREVLLLEKMLKERGIDRELVGTNEFKDMNDFKEKKEQIQELDTKIVDLEKKYTAEREKLQEGVQELVKAVESSKSVEGIEAEKAGVFDRKNVKMPLESFENMKTLAKASEALKTQNKTLEHDLSFSVHEKQELQEENTGLKNENEELKRENERLQEVNRIQARTIQYLNDMVHLLKKNSVKFLDVSRERMVDFMGKVRAAALTHEFKKTPSEKLMTIIPEEEKEGAKVIFDLQKQKQEEKQKEAEAQKEKEKTAAPKKRPKEIEHER
ncbi:plasmid recombination protein, partial [Klebsiella pneumoniae]|uniref:plasmid recombination protein n=1 Tax=Klebsiella pneumoniae TaxID=573 RepID=UPI00224A76F1